MASRDKLDTLPDSISIASWSVDDIAERAALLGAELSLDEQLQVLQRIDREHDANIGICWDVIGTHIESHSKADCKLTASAIRCS